MSKINSVTANSSYPTEGLLPVKMTNDLLFHYMLQDPDSADVLKGIISSFYDIAFEDIKSVSVENPISYGQDLSTKPMILDVKTLLNDDKFINLEMQVINYMDWPERSIAYLCRCFDNLKVGEPYSKTKGAFHIGFLDFTLFPESPEFYSKYTIRNEYTNRLYSGKFGIYVVDLNHIDLATNNDKLQHRHLWASFFKAKTWEEIRMLATQDKKIEVAATKLHHLSEDQKLRDEIWAREDQLRRELDRDNYYNSEIAKRDKEIAQHCEEIAKQSKEIAQQSKEIAQQSKEIVQKKNEIAKQKDELEKYKSLLIANGIDLNE